MSKELRQAKGKEKATSLERRRRRRGEVVAVVAWFWFSTQRQLPQNSASPHVKPTTAPPAASRREKMDAGELTRR